MRARASLSREGLSAKSAAETQDETESLAPHGEAPAASGEATYD
jgi:hypothetical protein